MAECGARFRLRWQIGGRRLGLDAVVRLRCPSYGASFKQPVAKLTVFSAGAAEFPPTAVITLTDVDKVA